MYYYVNNSIVNVIVGEIIFHPEDANDETTKERDLSIFEDVVGPKENEQDSDFGPTASASSSQTPYSFASL